LKFRVPEIVLGALLTVAVFATGMLFSSQHPQQGIGIDPKHRAAESVQSRSDAQHASPGEVKPVGQQQQSGGHGDTHEIYGVKPGEFLLFLATIGLWYATILLVKDARKTAERQLRAYVVVVTVDFITQTSADSRFEGVFKIRNAGQTPAYKMRVKSHTCPLSHPIGSDFNFVVDDLADQSIVMLGPREDAGHRSVAAAPLTADEIQLVTNPGSAARLYTYGVVLYEDSFGKERFTNFCYFVDWAEVPGVPNAHSITMHVSKHHNDAN
jgi:hypothetical protein